MLSTFNSSGAAVCDRSYARVDSGRGGTPIVVTGTIQVAAAGYERALQLNVPELRFLTWVRLRTDELGGAVHELRTAASDRPGRYALGTSPRTQTLGRSWRSTG